MLQSGGQNQHWPTSGLGGYITPALWRVPNTSERGTKSYVGQKWAWWLHNPRRLGGSPTLQSGGQKEMWATSGPSGYITPAIWGVPKASQQGTK